MATKPNDTATLDIEAQVAALRADIAALAANLSAMSRSGTTAMQQAATDAYADLKAKGGEDFARAEAKAKQAMTDVTDYATKNPLQMLGMAAGLGILLGLLFGRR